MVKLMTTKGHGGLYRLLELYEIVPNFLTKAEVKVLYNRILLAQVSSLLPPLSLLPSPIHRERSSCPPPSPAEEVHWSSQPSCASS